MLVRMQTNSGGGGGDTYGYMGVVTVPSSGGSITTSNYKTLLDDTSKCLFVETGFKFTKLFACGVNSNDGRDQYIQAMFIDDVKVYNHNYANNATCDGDYYYLQYVAVKAVDNGFYITADSYYYNNKNVAISVS